MHEVVEGNLAVRCRDTFDKVSQHLHLQRNSTLQHWPDSKSQVGGNSAFRPPLSVKFGDSSWIASAAGMLQATIHFSFASTGFAAHGRTKDNNAYST